MEIPESFQRHRDVIEEQLRKLVEERSGHLNQMIRYQLGWIDEQGESLPRIDSGLRTYASLCLLSCQALNGNALACLPGAAALELTHNSFAVHDQIQGGGPQSSNRPSVWWIWGPGQAINAGDSIYALARIGLFPLEQHGMSAETVLQVIRSLDEACLRMCEGHYQELIFQERIDVGVTAYLEMAGGKSGALMSCAMEVGALLAGVKSDAGQMIAQYGFKLGVAHQICEDIDLVTSLYEGTQSHDVLNKKKNLPLAYALEKADVHKKRVLGSIYLKRMLDQSDLETMADILEDTNAIQCAQNLADEYYNEALQSVQDLDLSPEWREELRNVAGFLAYAPKRAIEKSM